MDESAKGTDGRPDSKQTNLGDDIQYVQLYVPGSKVAFFGEWSSHIGNPHVGYTNPTIGYANPIVGLMTIPYCMEIIGV